MRQMVFFVLGISLLSCGCQQRTHLFGFVGDENKTPIIGAKMAVIQVNYRNPLKTDTLAISYTKKNGYHVNLIHRRRHQNVRLVNPYLINADLRDKYRVSQVTKGGKVIPDSDCCKIVIGIPNEHSFVLKNKQK
jgi:hypothetical protein